MEKIAIGSNLPKNLVDLDNSVEKNLSLLAEAKKINIDQLTACILDRPRHKNIIESCQKMNENSPGAERRVDQLFKNTPALKKGLKTLK